MDTSIHCLFLWNHQLSEVDPENLCMGKLWVDYWGNTHGYFTTGPITFIL